MAAALIAPQQAPTARLIGLVVDSLTSPESKRSYRKALDGFLDWYGREPRAGFTKATVQSYRGPPGRTRPRRVVWRSPHCAPPTRREHRAREDSRLHLRVLNPRT